MNWVRLAWCIARPSHRAHWDAAGIVYDDFPEIVWC